MNQDTIAAISTGMTNSGIGIVRISGSEALEIADRVYKGKETITEVPTHTIHYGHVMDGDETVDEVLVMVMRGPRTFTGEDTVEINCHGGTYVVSRVLETVLKAGARPAEPGEFTKRAFLNGKMDLSQAEAVIDVITSEITCSYFDRGGFIFCRSHTAGCKSSPDQLVKPELVSGQGFLQKHRSPADICRTDCLMSILYFLSLLNSLLCF